jgi:hypothetical protein
MPSSPSMFGWYVAYLYDHPTELSLGDEGKQAQIGCLTEPSSVA